MPFNKILKDKSYFKRFQVHYRRRREGKTDYVARRAMICQDKTKYNTPKYRLVVRITNHDIICQIVYSQLDGDRVLAAAYSHELPKYGITLGLTNYAAAYATGLLIARRVLNLLKLDDKYKGCEEVNGEDYSVEAIEGQPKPFMCILDVGLARTSTGARIFGALKGACDGGLNIPHSENRFVGYKSTGNHEGELNADVLRKYIFGGHVADYMRHLKDVDEKAYQRQFSRYAKAGIKPEDLEKIYAEAHKKIRADPKFVKKEAKKVEKHKYVHKRKLNNAQRKERVKTKKANLAKKAAAAEEE